MLLPIQRGPGFQVPSSSTTVPLFPLSTRVLNFLKYQYQSFHKVTASSMNNLSFPAKFELNS